MSTSSREEPPLATPLFAPVRGRLRWIVVLSGIGAVMSVVPLVAVVELAHALWPLTRQQPVDTARVWLVVAIVGGASVIGFATGWGSLMAGHLADSDLQRDVRTRLVEHLGRLPLGWFSSRSSGLVKKTVSNDVSALHHLTGHAIHDLVVAIVVPGVSLLYLFATEWRMALVCLVPLVVTVALYAAMMAGAKDQLVKYDESVERLNSATIEFVNGIAVVKSFGQGAREHARYAGETERFLRFYRGWMAETSVMQTIVEVVTAPVVVLAWVAAAGTWLVSAEAIAPLDLLPALLLGLGLSAPLLQLGYTGQAIRNALQARQSITAFLSQPTMPRPSAPAQPRGCDARFAGVSFSYDGVREVLHEIDAACAPGTVTALVGPSGSGKSTLARLLPRFHDTSAGTVEIGATDVRQVDPVRLYRSVGFVFQDPYLLRTTIRDNIRLTRPDVSHEQVERAAAAAQIAERIRRLPRGFDSIIGDDAHLSGGEAQRVMIARALVTDAPILVLDEATAALDPDSEAAVQDAISALSRGRSLLVIAHRLHTIVGADQILVLDEGRIVQRGAHAALLGEAGLYRDLWERHERTHTGRADAATGIR